MSRHAKRPLATEVPGRSMDPNKTDHQRARQGALFVFLRPAKFGGASHYLYNLTGTSSDTK